MTNVIPPEPPEQEPLDEDELNQRLRDVYDASTTEERGEVEDGEV